MRIITYVIANLDNYIEKKNKVYFLIKKITQYKRKLHYNERWNIQKIRKYERKWKYLKQKYNAVNVYGIEFMGIGETIPRLFMYLRNNRTRDRRIFHVILPTFMPNYAGGIVNKKIFEIFGKHMYFITEDNIDFWTYVIIIHAHKINIEYFDLYKYRIPKRFNIKVGRALIPFEGEMKQYAKCKMNEMGINGEYICLYAREAATKVNNYKGYPDTSVAAADINAYRGACAYVQGLGYQTVRMGKDESRKCEIGGVIDYANKFYDELMDFYLIANCKFLIGGAGGLSAITAYWGRPLLLVNECVLCYGRESFPITKYDLYMPKKFYSKEKKRLLNLYEMLIISDKCDRYNENYNREGIVVIDNTEDEILQATIEMNEKMNHTWVQTEEEKRYMEKYWTIMNLWKSRHKTSLTRMRAGAKGYEMEFRPICYSFLRKNLYLLDVEEVV